MRKKKHVKETVSLGLEEKLSWIKQWMVTSDITVRSRLQAGATRAWVPAVPVSSVWPWASYQSV